MTKTMTIKPIPTRRNQGFTLIEMLVVAALIAIFAGLAVFNIVEQLEREKEKAAIAEARSIATAMSFAHNDMGFYPKLCFLRFGIDELTDIISDYSLPNDSVDWFDRGGPTMATALKSNWSVSKYMAGSMPDKYVQMTIGFRSGGTQSFNWPADPWKQPYAGYFVTMRAPAGNPNAPKVKAWADQSLGERATYFAGIVSYGRNKTPGMAWDDIRKGQAPYIDNSLFAPDPDGISTHFVTSYARYNQARLDFFTEPQTAPNVQAPWTGNPPHIRDAGSDDKFFEF